MYQESHVFEFSTEEEFQKTHDEYICIPHNSYERLEYYPLFVEEIPDDVNNQILVNRLMIQKEAEPIMEQEKLDAKELMREISSGPGQNGPSNNLQIQTDTFSRNLVSLKNRMIRNIPDRVIVVPKFYQHLYQNVKTKDCDIHYGTICLKEEADDRIVNNKLRENPANLLSIYYGKNGLPGTGPLKGFLPILFKTTTEANLCEVAREHGYGILSCKEVYKHLLQSCTFQAPPSQVQPTTPFKIRFKKFIFAGQKHQKKKDKKRYFRHYRETRIAREHNKSKREIKALRNDLSKEVDHEPVSGPCSHFGRCGPFAKDCVCKDYCSPRCECDIDCSRRFPGCDCAPGQCQTEDCQCIQQRNECEEGLCHRCLDHENDRNVPMDRRCGNHTFQCAIETLLKIQKSKVLGAGFGAVAKRDIKKGEIVGEYTGEQITDDKADRRGQVYHYGTSYVYHLPYAIGALDPAKAGNETRFINHSNTHHNFQDVERRSTSGFCC